jgi:hypothetical protein
MARASLNSPIFRDAGGELQFTKEMQNPSLFTTTMPGATFFDALQIDPAAVQSMDMSWAGGGIDALGASVANGLATAQSLQELIGSQAAGLVGEMQELAAIDVVQAMRAVVGQVATTVGFLPQTLNAHNGVRGTYLEPLRNVVVGLEIANKVINSEYFQQAVDAIAWIPIIGWIIKIVAEVLTLVLSIAERVREKRIEKMSYALAQRFHLPLMAADPDLKKAYNQQMTRNVLSYVSDYSLWKVFQPPYLVADGSGKRFETVAARDPDATEYDLGDAGTIQLTQGWYMRGIAPGTGATDEIALAGGAGFAPGGSALFRALEFQTEYGGAEPRNIGNYASTAREAAAFLWQTTLKPGPAMFCLNTKLTEENWTNYLHGMLEYGERCILKGFTVSESSVRDTHRWGDCTDLEWVYKDEYKGDKAGTKRHFPGGWGAVSHMGELLNFLMREFWGRGAEQNQYPYPTRDTGKEFSPDNYYFQNTVYAHALRNMDERQRSVVQGYEAFSVFPGTEFFDDLTGRTVTKSGGIFPAFGSPSTGWNSSLISRWEDTIRLVLGEKSLWQNLDWRDVPQYTWKGQSPREILKAKQGGGGGFMIVGPGGAPPVPGGPDMFPPPSPPSLVGGNRQMVMLSENPNIDLDGGGFSKVQSAVRGMPTATKAMLAGAAAMGAVVGLNELYRLGRSRIFI